MSKTQYLLYFIKILPLNLLKFFSKFNRVFKPNCIVIGGKIIENIIFVNLDDTLELIQNEKKYIKQYINKLTIIANLVFSKKL
jgi:hypothetical protein